MFASLMLHSGKLLSHHFCQDKWIIRNNEALHSIDIIFITNGQSKKRNTISHVHVKCRLSKKVSSHVITPLETSGNDIC